MCVLLSREVDRLWGGARAAAKYLASVSGGAMDEEEEEPQGRGVRELIAAYRQGEDRADLFHEARYLRNLPGADGELPEELVNALYCARDEPDPDWMNQINIPVAIGPDILVADLALDLVEKKLMAVLVVLDEHLVLIIGGSSGSMTDAHAWIFDRLRECDREPSEEEAILSVLGPAPAHFRPIFFGPKEYKGLGTVTGLDDEEAATIVDWVPDLILGVVETRRNGEQVVACSDFMDLEHESLDGFRLIDTHEDIINTLRGLSTRCSLDDMRARYFFSYVTRSLYDRLVEKHSDQSPTSGFPESGFYRRQRNFTRRIPHVLLRSLVTKARAIEPQTRKKTRRFADACLYAFLYGAMPAPVFREVVMFL